MEVPWPVMKRTPLVKEELSVSVDFIIQTLQEKFNISPTEGFELEWMLEIPEDYSDQSEVVGLKFQRIINTEGKQ